MFKNSILLFTCCLTILVSCTDDREISQAGNLVPKTVVEDLNLPSITINGAKLHAQAFGPADSTLVIVLHGGPGANFKYMLNCISLADKGYRVVFYDQIGSGLSQRFPRSYYLNFGEAAVEKVFYDELTGVINYYKKQPDQKVVLLTQSWGSMLGTGYAAKYPDKVDGLILAEPGGLKWPDIIAYINKSRSFNVWSEELNDATYQDQFITGKTDDHAILDYKLAILSASNTIVGDIQSTLGPNSIYYKSVRNGAVIASVMLEIGEKYQSDFSSGISQFQKNVIFFYSSNNTAYPDSWAQKISAIYPQKEVVKVNGVGHSGMFDQLETWRTITEPKVIKYLNSL